ncbi:MAG: hypothetical protein GC185_09695 [Alphaproteobacteria bacterium]|nr:hypothetical protein [Alphaproteobacteria bacterium]
MIDDVKSGMQRKARSGCPHKQEWGYSLVEMAIVIGVVGLLTAGFFSVYNVYVKTQQRQTTDNNSSAVTSALTNYLIQNGHYPCPARSDAKRSDADYGVETECDSTKPGYPALAVGTCANGLCEEQGQTQSADYQNVKYVCTKINSGLVPLDMIVTAGREIVDVTFASYGQPSGDFTGSPNDCSPTFTEAPTCNALDSVKVLRDKFKGETGFSMRSLSVNDSTFGGDPCPTVLPAGPGQRWLYAVFKEADAGASVVTEKVRRGMVPFRTLGLPETLAEDGYGQRFEYAVTEPLATDQYKQENGAITVVDSAHTIAQYVHYVIFSPGQDHNGAYTAHGVQMQPCKSGRLDTENCNTTTDSNAVYRYTAFSTAQGPTHFDDYLKYYTSTETPLWRVSNNTNFSIEQMNSGKVGIGMDPTASSAVLQVAGTVHTNQDALADRICDKAGNCIPADAMGRGDATTPNSYADLECPAGEYITGLKDGKVQCGSAPASGCNEYGKFVSGVDASGNVICSSVVGCGKKKRVQCGETKWLPGVQPGTTSAQNSALTLGPFGDSYQEVWECTTDGAWKLDSTSGYCDCTPGPSTTTWSCNSGHPQVGSSAGSYNNYGRGWWTGNYTKTVTTSCGSTITTTSSTTNDCACQDKTFTKPVSCGTGMTGSQSQTQDWTCSGTTTGSYGSWSGVTGTCTCDSSYTLSDEVKSCSISLLNGTGPGNYGPGYNSGNVKRTRTWICDSATSGHIEYGTPVDTCTCQAIKGTPCQTGCVSPYAGTQTHQQTFDCSTNSWDPPQCKDAPVVVDNCGLQNFVWTPQTGTTVAQSNQPVGHAAGVSCTTQGQTSPCYKPKTGGDYDNYASCECE